MTKPESLDRILFCSSFTPPVNAGGGKNAYNFAKFLSEKDYKVTLLSLNRKGKLKRRETTNGLRVVRILYLNFNILTKILSLLIILPGYIFHVLKNQVVFIYGGNIIGFEFLIYVGWLFNKTVIFRSTMFGEDDLETLVHKRFAGRMREKIMKGITLYFSMNPAFTKSWENIYNSTEKVFESVQGVNIKVFSPANKEDKRELRAKLNIPHDKLIIVTVGYLVKRKGFREIFESLHNLDVPFKYLVVGNYSVPDYHYLVHINPEMKELFDLGITILGDKISFIGPVENVNEYLQASDVFILNSTREGFPNALLEAMACGLPSIIKQIPGIYNGFIRHGENALFLEECERISDCLIKLNNQSKTQKSIGENAVDSINEYASFEIVYSKLFSKLFSK